jgi:hypothetical protein
MSKSKQIIKLKPADLNRVVVRGLGRSAWEKVKTLPVKEQVHRSLKKKALKHKKSPLEDYNF